MLLFGTFDNPNMTNPEVSRKQSLYLKTKGHNENFLVTPNITRDSATPAPRQFLFYTQYAI